MSKIILSSREFKEEWLAEIAKKAPEYHFTTTTEKLDWSSVTLTIGWSKEWEEHLLSADSTLKWVQSISAGVDTLPLAKFREKNILLSNSSGIHAQAIAEHVLAAILMTTRGFTQTVKNQSLERWSAQDIHFRYLTEQEILIVGTGHIGQKLAELLQGLGAAPVGINTSGHPVAGFSKTYSLDQLEEVSQKADFVINILPLTPETTHLYDSDFFETMNPTGTFINVGRGASVDTSALVAALKNGQIQQALLDVFEEEPLPQGHPLWQLENCIITPHISGMTPHFQKAFMEIFLNNLSCFVTTGELAQNQVSLTEGY